jgi:hypothetical protein
VWKLLLEVDAVTVASEGWVPQLRGLYTTGWDSTDSRSRWSVNCAYARRREVANSRVEVKGFEPSASTLRK